VAERRRPRYRYIVFELESEQRMSERTVGELLAAASGRNSIRLIQFENEQGIVRCIHTAKDEVISGLNGRHRIGGNEVSIKTIGTSGTIRRARSKFLA